jgi:hypothetical protein
MLAGEKERLDQLPFTTDCHPREPPVPLTFRDFGFGVEPTREQLELRRRNRSTLDAVEEVQEESGGKAPAADLRHGCP